MKGKAAPCGPYASISKAARALGVHYRRLARFLDQEGGDFEKAAARVKAEPPKHSPTPRPIGGAPSLAEAARREGIPAASLRRELKAGLDFEAAVALIRANQKAQKTMRDEARILGACREAGVNTGTVWGIRRKLGLSLDEAIAEAVRRRDARAARAEEQKLKAQQTKRSGPKRVNGKIQLKQTTAFLEGKPAWAIADLIRRGL